MKIPGANDQFFKESKKKKEANGKESDEVVVKDKIWLNIVNDSKTRFDNILIAFNEDMTDEFDIGYDSHPIKFGKNILFYSQIEDKKMVIQTLSNFNEEKKVTLGFDTALKDSFTIRKAKTEGVLKDVDVYLVDHLLNITHDLNASDYHFEQTVSGSFPNRFTLQFTGQALDVDDEIFGENGFVISNDYESLKIRSTKEVKEIRVYDMLGRLIIQKQPNKKSFHIETTTIKNGTVLIVKATLENGTVVSKKTIKY